MLKPFVFYLVTNVRTLALASGKCPSKTVTHPYLSPRRLCVFVTSQLSVVISSRASRGRQLSITARCPTCYRELHNIFRPGLTSKSDKGFSRRMCAKEFVRKGPRLLATPVRCAQARDSLPSRWHIACGILAHCGISREVTRLAKSSFASLVGDALSFEVSFEFFVPE